MSEYLFLVPFLRCYFFLMSLLATLMCQFLFILFYYILCYYYLLEGYLFSKERKQGVDTYERGNGEEQGEVKGGGTVIRTYQRKKNNYQLKSQPVHFSLPPSLSTTSTLYFSLFHSDSISSIMLSFCQLTTPGFKDCSAMQTIYQRS